MRGFFGLDIPRIVLRIAEERNEFWDPKAAQSALASKARERITPPLQLGAVEATIVEVDRLDQVEAVVTAGVDTILLDNFSLEDLRAAVELIAGRVTVEASGNTRRHR